MIVFRAGRVTYYLYMREKGSPRLVTVWSTVYAPLAHTGYWVTAVTQVKAGIVGQSEESGNSHRVG